MSTILEKACATLWTGSDLDEAALLAALARAGSRGVDWADLYFQHIESHDWLLEEGIVKTGHFSIDRGYGLRTVAGERQALSYADDLAARHLLASADDLRSLTGSRSVTMPARLSPQTVRPLYSPDVEATEPSREIELLRHIDRYARSLSPAVRNVTATLQAEVETVLVADLEGRLTADIRPQIYLSVNVLAEQNGRTEQGTSGGGARCGIEHFTRERVEAWCEKAVREAVLQTEARPAPSGVMPVVLGPGWPGILLHEAVGHGL
ncbi:MAG TPA: metalloprotease TldD, partial [Candidatus Sutterella merdavium]|nr:metalloprotease TldD [Candidatus Sutterella merdavium]